LLRTAGSGEQFSQSRNFLCRQRRIVRRRQHRQNLPAPRARREVSFAPGDFVRVERPLVVRRDQLGIGAFPGVARRDLVQRLAHPTRERFFSLPVS
jgi:hypothetical protein